MALRPDYQDVLTVFVYTNLPVLMNPANAANVVVSDTITPTTPTTPTTPVTSGTPVPVIVITPDVLLALQAATLNNFTNLGLPSDIQEIAKNFFALLPPVIPTTTAANATATIATT